MAAAILVGLPAAAALVYVLPAGASFLPPCLFHYVTGLHCPGCGATRCTRALLHGDLRQALAYNALFMVSLPFLACLAVRWLYGLWRGRPLARWHVPNWTTAVLVVLLIMFAILRNIDRFPFNLLAPHELPG